MLYNLQFFSDKHIVSLIKSQLLHNLELCRITVPLRLYSGCTPGPMYEKCRLQSNGPMDTSKPYNR